MLEILISLQNAINNSKWLSIFLIIVGIIIVINICSYVITLFKSIKKLIINKANSIEIANIKKLDPKNELLSIPERIALMNDILDLISFMINYEITYHIKNILILNNPYDMSNLDKDVSEISNKVYEGINKDLFKDKNLVMTDAYLLQFITKKTISQMLDIVQVHNNNIRSN